MKTVRKKNKLISLFIMLIVLHGVAVYNVNGIRKSIGYSDHLQAPLIPNTMLKMIAGEFKGITADFILLEISAFLNGTGEDVTQEQWGRVSYHFSQTMSLDPYFRQTYQMVQAFLPWNGRAREANELLKLSKEHLYWDWTPTYFIGFNYFYFLNDNATASKYLIEASRMPGAPAMLATLGARLSQGSGKTEAAIVFLKTMVHNPDYDENAKKLIELRISLLESVLYLENAIRVYEKKMAKKPDKLSDLIDSGIISEIPKHSEYREFGYRDGKITY